MFDHLHGDDGVKPFRRGGQVFGAAYDIAYGKALRLRMGARHGDAFGERIDAHDGRAKPRQRLAQQAAAAADIGDA
jgi:hypothetical protein